LLPVTFGLARFCVSRRNTFSRHHRAAAKRRDPVIPLFAEKMDRPVKPGDDG